MATVAADLMGKLHDVNPYANFPLRDYRLDLQGGQADPLFRRLFTDVRPRLIVEVGSWKGDSAIAMATILAENKADAAVVCVDTWLGSLEHLTGAVPGWDIRPYVRHGYPTLYYQFLANVLHSGCQDRIVPVPNTSANAARWLQHHRITADLVYLDGSHEEDDVYQDLGHFWKIVRPGGVLFGDDWHAYWYGVICAVNRFARERQLHLQIANQKWLLQKPL
jgi:predicted O-methyltransferase YrrM